jgi:heterodisulfide reductase subunit B2
MNFALLRCCTTPVFLKQYETSTNAVLEKFGIGIQGDGEFNCCGYPLRNFNYKAYLLASARNLALAERKGLDMLTVCNCCYGSLKHAEHILQEDTSVGEEIRKTLAGEGLTHNGTIAARHLLDVLHQDVGIDRIKKTLKRTYRGLRMATHYGCHILRPSEIVQFDSPFAPVKFDQLVEATGAESIPWSGKLECCGSPLFGTNDELSTGLTGKKLAGAKQAGADYLCVACSYCQLQFDRVQKMMLDHSGADRQLPSVLYTQLLGLCLGIDEELLGLTMNQLPVTGMERFLQPGPEARN